MTEAPVLLFSSYLADSVLPALGLPILFILVMVFEQLHLLDTIKVNASSKGGFGFALKTKREVQEKPQKTVSARQPQRRKALRKTNQKALPPHSDENPSPSLLVVVVNARDLDSGHHTFLSVAQNEQELYEVLFFLIEQRRALEEELRAVRDETDRLLTRPQQPPES